MQHCKEAWNCSIIGAQYTPAGSMKGQDLGFSFCIYCKPVAVASIKTVLVEHGPIQFKQPRLSRCRQEMRPGQAELFTNTKSVRS